MLCDRLGFSERRACQLAGQHRSTQRREPAVSQDDHALRSELRAFSRERPRWGYRQAHHRLCEEGWAVNRKRVARLWREEGLRVPRRAPASASASGNQRCPGIGCGPRGQMKCGRSTSSSTRPADGRVLKLLHVIDEFTREALAIRCKRQIDADATVRLLEQIVAQRGRAPELLRCDNGPEMTANALRDWCRFSGTGSAYIDPGSPWQNPFVESFGSRIRDELLTGELFETLLEAQVLVEDWRNDYNTQRPHSSLGMRAPARFAAEWTPARPAGPAGLLRSPSGLTAQPSGEASTPTITMTTHP